MKAWVDRKAFIHNLGHATAAYSWSSRNIPEATFMYEVLGDEKVYWIYKKGYGGIGPYPYGKPIPGNSPNRVFQIILTTC